MSVSGSSPIVAVRAIVPDGRGRVLLIRRPRQGAGAGRWCLPGGKVHSGEALETAVMRELAEETGLQASSARFLFYQDSPPTTARGVHYLNLYFECVAAGDVHTTEEAADWQWVGPDDLPRLAIAFHNDEGVTQYWRERSAGAASRVCPPSLPRALRQASRLLRRDEGERAIRALMAWPDKACAPDSGLTYERAADLLEAPPETAPDDEGPVALVRYLCLYRAGFTTRAGEGLGSLCHRGGTGSAGSGWALACAARFCLSLALRRLGDPQQAAGEARSAGALARAHAAPWLEGWARLALGRALRDIAGQRHRAASALDEAARLFSQANPSDPLAVAFVAAHRARLALDAAQPVRALELIREAQKGFARARHHRALAGAMIYQGWAHLQLRAPKTAATYGRQAFERLVALGSRRTAIKAQKLLARAALDDRDPEAALVLGRELVTEAERLDDPALRAEGKLIEARACFASDDLTGASRALRGAEAASRACGTHSEAPVLAALRLAIQIRRRRWAGVDDGLRRLRGALLEREAAGPTAECLALCGFELARQRRFRQAGPLLAEALAAARESDASQWVEGFLATAEGSDARDWIAALATEVRERAKVAEDYSALHLCTLAGLHDVKNKAFSAQCLLDIAELTARSAGDELPATVREARDAAHDGASLARAVMEQVRAGTVAIEVGDAVLDIAAFLERQRDAIAGSHEHGGCALEVEPCLPPVRGEARYLTRLFGNLVANAAKYAPGTRVTISASLRRVGRKQYVEVCCRDAGPGIDPLDQEILFEPFKDPRDYRRKLANHGTGFGLYYCRKVVEAHGGRIWVESELGGGAAFHFTLPVARAAG